MASLGTLQEVHNIACFTEQPPPPGPGCICLPLSLERFHGLRAVTVDDSHYEPDRCLPALPASVQTLDLSSGHYRRCG